MNHLPQKREVIKMADEETVQEQIEQPIEQPEEGRIETHCYLCQQELIEGEAMVGSNCGVGYHEECAKRAVKCPACGENLLEQFLNEETRDGIVKKDRLYTMLLILIPFVLVEILIAILSIVNHPSWLTMPPMFGEAFLLDLVVLLVGIIVAVMIYAKLGYKPEKKAINALVLRQKGANPSKADEQIYTCGYGDRARPILFGDVSIPNKVGVQRDNVVRVQVDRLSMTDDGAYIWLNPRFLKLLPAKNNPQPSNPEELEQVWKISGRTTVAGEGKPAEEEKICATCGKPMEYINEYDAWYCSSCGKYDEDTQQQDLPPPDGEPPPPPDDEPPAPEDE
jgi:DNA-directed RNA polymerase subunit RPC12/RpoP